MESRQQGFAFDAGRLRVMTGGRMLGRPKWVYGGTALVVLLVVAGPLLVLLLALLVAGLLGVVVFWVLDLLAKGLGVVTGRSGGVDGGAMEVETGRENVRVREG
ncbi:MAG: hypothetical protein AAF797_10610 [Planctomycetota bacterium]